MTGVSRVDDKVNLLDIDIVYLCSFCVLPVCGPMQIHLWKECSVCSHPVPLFFPNEFANSCIEIINLLVEI